MDTVHATPTREAQRPMTAAPERSAPTTAGREVELKLQCSADALAELAHHPVFASADARVTRRLRTVYFDTPDLRLAAAGVAVRMRHEDGRHIQSVKTMSAGTPADAAGVAVRREWEWPVAGESPDLVLLAQDDVRPLVPANALPDLEPLFVTDLERTTLVLHPDPLTAIEVALDLGIIRAGTASRPVSEVELELKAGPVGRLFELARALQRIMPVRIATESKADLGLALVTGRGPRPVQPEPLALSPATTVAEAFRHIVRHCLGHLLANEAPTLSGLPVDSPSPEGGQTEGLHQMRVALRRLRVALRFFGGVIESPALDELAGEIRWLADRLTPVRHWDVFLSSFIEPFSRRNAGLVGLEVLAEEAVRARHEEAGDALDAIQSARYTSFLLNLAGWLEEGGWHAGAAPARRARLDRPMRELAVPWLDACQRKVRKAGKRVQDLDADDQDRL
ncbi:MAG TPA: CYTH and CHAD domain-containing protein, partial [Azospirillaceae bacterium]|nr:CYTH and CHAD domain-containing protein [Azospirillaceae bacterium]